MTSSGEGRHPVHEFLHTLWVKVQDDDVFFMASAISFNMLVAAIPLALLGVGLTAYALSAQISDPTEAIVSLLVGNLPQAAAGLDPSAMVRALVQGVLARRSGFTFLGALLFVWLATRLVGTLRTVLRRVFQVTQARGIIRGKLFDAQVVVLGVVLLTLNLGVTIAFEAALRVGGRLVGLGGPMVSTLDFFVGNVVAVTSIWTLFLVVYRYLPARRTPWIVAVISATFAAVVHEVLKQGFSWYATEVADYSSTWGNLATVAVLLFWIYYEALVFIMAGEMAQVSMTMRARAVEPSDSPEATGPEAGEGGDTPVLIS
jgi:membrane protein